MEREQKVAEQEKTKLHASDPFHVRLIDADPKFSDDLRIWSYDVENPLFLKNLDDEALQELAKNVIKNRWPGYCKQEQFLKRLGKFDPKKRPLFAIILAYAFKESEQEISTERDTILLDVIKNLYSTIISRITL